VFLLEVYYDELMRVVFYGLRARNKSLHAIYTGTYETCQSSTT